MENLAADIRHALQQFARRPGFSAVVVLTLALGIGFVTTMFSVMDGVLLRPLAYRDPSRLVTLRQSWAGSPEGRVSPAEFADYSAKLHAIGPVGAYVTGAANLSGDGAAERVRAGYVTTGLLPALGVSPAQGRWFAEGEDSAGAPPVVILSDALWRRRFGAATVVGHVITVDGQPNTIIGIMPRGFALPEDHRTGTVSDVYQPLTLGPVNRSMRGSHFLLVVGRTKGGMSAGDAQADVRSLANAFRREFPTSYPEPMQFTATVHSIDEDVLGNVRGPVIALFGAVALVLLIACVNVANILLVRADARRREFAVRVALGARKRRLVAQLVAESAVLALAAGILGAVLAIAGVAAIRAAAPHNLPRIADVAVDARSLAFAAFIAAAVGVAFGIVPALRNFELGLAGGLREAGPGLTAARGRHRTRRSLVIAEAALAMLLAAGAGLMIHSFARLQSVDPGFRTTGVLTARVSLPGATYQDSTRIRDYFSGLIERLALLPGVRSAGAVTNLPLTGQLGDINIQIAGRETALGELQRRSDWQVVTPGYFAAMGMRLIKGRLIERSDRENTPGVVVINERLARQYWPDGDALGARFTLGGGAGPGMVTVVGIVADVRHASLAEVPDAEMYLAHRQFHFWSGGGPASSMVLAIAADGSPLKLAADVRRVVAEMDPTVPVGQVLTMEDVASTAVAQPRFLAQLFGAFSLAALFLAGVGLYGVLSYIVRLRRNEFAVRMAFGATPRRIGAMVVRDAIFLAGLGIATGLAASLVLGRVLRGLLYEVSSTDPLALAGGATLLVTTALLAALIPVLRAIRLGPAFALRGE